MWLFRRQTEGKAMQEQDREEETAAEIEAARQYAQHFFIGEEEVVTEKAESESSAGVGPHGGKSPRLRPSSRWDLDCETRALPGHFSARPIGGLGEPSFSSSNSTMCSSPRNSFWEEDMLQKEADMEAKLQEKDSKLKAASKALARERNKVLHLTAQLGLKDLQLGRLESQNVSMQHLLVAKERKLRELALDLEKAVRLAEANIFAASNAIKEPLRELPEHPPELTAPQGAVMAENAELQKKFAAVTALLHSEQQHRAQCEELRDTCTQREEQVLRLLTCLEEKDREIEAITDSHTTRVRIEDQLQQVLANKGRQWHPHFEV